MTAERGMRRWLARAVGHIANIHGPGHLEILVEMPLSLEAAAATVIPASEVRRRFAARRMARGVARHRGNPPAV